MIRIIKSILISLFWRAFFHNISKINFINVLNNINTYLRALSFREQIRFIKSLFTDSVLERDRFLFLTHPFQLSIYFSTLSKKIVFFVFIFSIVATSWLRSIKILILLPFKLGIFSFLYSIIGFDVTWFLNLFNFFPINIPYWVYFQYLNLYHNWLVWWNKIVIIKSITTVPLIGKNKIIENTDSIETTKPASNNNNLYYIMGGIIIVGSILLGLWYFDYLNFGNNRPGPGAGGSSGTNAPDTTENIFIRNNQTNTEQISEISNQNSSTSSTSSVATAPSAPSTDSAPTSTNNDPSSSANQEWTRVERSKPSSSSSDVVTDMNQRMEALNNSSGFSSSNVQSRSFNRYNVLDQLEQENNKNIIDNRPDSPTGSTDSSETIIPSSSPNSRSKGKAVLRRASNLFKK